VGSDKNLAGSLEPGLCSDGLPVGPAPDSDGLQLKPAPETRDPGWPCRGWRKIRVLPEAGAVEFPIFSELKIGLARCKNTHIQ
jgi:hypothetical protein